MSENPSPSNDSQVIVMVGTRKGGLIFSSDAERRQWRSSDLMFKGWNVMHMTQDPRNGRLHAAVVHDVYGPTTHYSDDLGETWTQADQVPAFTGPSESGRPLGTPDEVRDQEAAKEKAEKVLKVWVIVPGRQSEPGVLYAGIEPAALFKSEDGGATWAINEGFYNHPHRANFFPGAGGLCMHTILPHPTDENRMHVAVSTGGCYFTEDGGLSWSPRNKNVRADFLPDKFPEYGQCVHNMACHPSRPERLYQQNHCGVYRSDDAGENWLDIGEGKLPSRFGFPIAVHPHDPETIYVVLEQSDTYRLSVDHRLAVWRSRDAGNSWEYLTRGLPDPAYLVVLRQALPVDTLERAGLYFGTSTGQVFHTRDEGDSWDLLADFLPPVLSIEAAVI